MANAKKAIIKIFLDKKILIGILLLMENKINSNKEITKLIGRRIAILRISQKMSQAKLATKIGVCHQQMQKYENGKNRVSIDRLIAIAQALNVKIINFFPAFIVGEDIGDLLSARNAKEIKLLSKFAKFQKLSVEELVLRFLDLLLK